MKTIILDIGDESADWIKKFSQRPIKKSKVYVKNPSEVPQGKKLEEGKHGGHYYETNEQPQKQQPNQEEINSIIEYNTINTKRQYSDAPNINVDTDVNFVEKIKPYIQKTPELHKKQLSKKWINFVNHKTSLGRDAKMWDDKVERGETSKSLNQINGQYTPERVALHEKIINHFDKNTNDVGLAIFFGGPMGSGKGSLLNYVKDRKNKIYISNDEIKKLLPEYTQTNAPFLHDEARDISYKLMEKVLTKNKSFIYDATLHNVEKTKELMSNIRNLGYKINLLATNVPLEVSLERASKRFLESGYENRYVPINSMIRGHDLINIAQFELIKYVDSGIIFDNYVDKNEPHKVIAYHNIKYI